MPRNSTAASVPPVDRALGATVTFVAGAVLGYVLALVLTPSPTGATGTVPAFAGVVVGLTATVALVFGGGYDRLLVPVEGRRWVVELAFAFAVVTATSALAEAVTLVSDVFVVGVLALSLLGTRRVGDAVADARGWYDGEDDRAGRRRGED